MSKKYLYFYFYFYLVYLVYLLLFIYLLTLSSLLLLHKMIKYGNRITKTINFPNHIHYRKLTTDIEILGKNNKSKTILNINTNIKYKDLNSDRVNNTWHINRNTLYLDILFNNSNSFLIEPYKDRSSRR